MTRGDSTVAGEADRWADCFSTALRDARGFVPEVDWDAFHRRLTSRAERWLVRLRRGGPYHTAPKPMNR